MFLGDGSQIVAPADVEISAEIEAVGTVESIPRAEFGWETLDDTVVDAYVQRVASVALPDGPRDLRIVYTPLHGCGE